jgi:hypothetical protein
MAMMLTAASGPPPQEIHTEPVDRVDVCAWCARPQRRHAAPEAAGETTNWVMCPACLNEQLRALGRRSTCRPSTQAVDSEDETTDFPNSDLPASCHFVTRSSPETPDSFTADR